MAVGRKGGRAFHGSLLKRRLPSIVCNLQHAESCDRNSDVDENNDRSRGRGICNHGACPQVVHGG